MIATDAPRSLSHTCVHPQPTGWLHKAEVRTALAGFFRGRRPDRLEELYEALDTDEPGEVVAYRWVGGWRRRR